MTRLARLPACGAAPPPLRGAGAGKPRSSRSWRVFLHEGNKVVRREPADRVGQPDAARDLTLAGAARELPHALDHLREPGGGQRMATCLEPAGGIDGQAAVERRLAVEGDASRLARRHQPEVLERDQLE